jgi:hypothetical protein
MFRPLLHQLMTAPIRVRDFELPELAGSGAKTACALL